jgi:hypothetical protein
MPTATNIIGQVVTHDGKSRKVCLSIAPTPITSKNNPASTDPVLCSPLLFFIVFDFNTKLCRTETGGNIIQAILYLFSGKSREISGKTGRKKIMQMCEIIIGVRSIRVSKHLPQF